MLSKKTKYAINALVFIAKNKDDQPISVSRISEEQNIPMKFLESILTELKNARILKSKKGKYGGYSLNGTPEEISMAKVMRLLDGAIGLLPCVTHEFYERCEECIDEETCGIRQITMEIRNETVKRLKAATLADIIKREKKLKK
ncbi:MAG: Rrf2 family transcriptional regulator [Marinoscillum sp.]